MEFHYKVINREGAREEGHLQATSHKQAQRDLLERYASVLEINEVKRSKRDKPIKVKPELVVVFFRRLGTMVSSGVSWAAALEFMVTSTSDDSLSEAADHLARLVQEGRNLSAAMKSPRLSKVFDSVSIGMVAMGEQTGQLNHIINKIADLKERQLQLTKAFISALTYPAVLFCVILALGVLFSMILGPGDDGLFAAFGTEMPWPTRVVQQVSNFVRKPWLLLPIFAFLAAGGWLFFRQMRVDRFFRLRVHSLLLSIPAIGPLIRKIECARILYVMADALAVGVPVGTALHMSIDVCNNEKFKRELRQVHRDFCEGTDFSDALAAHDVFPPIILCMVETGLESGRLDYIMAQASVNFEEDVKLALDAVSQLAEPVMLIFAGIMAGFLALATLMPIIRMVETL